LEAVLGGWGACNISRQIWSTYDKILIPLTTLYINITALAVTNIKTKI